MLELSSQGEHWNLASRDAPIIAIGRLVRWYRPIVVYTVG